MQGNIDFANIINNTEQVGILLALLKRVVLLAALGRLASGEWDLSVQK